MRAKIQAFKPEDDSVTPLYLQLASKLADGIKDGTWQAGQALPSERMLSEGLGISRVTARKAIDLLCERGLLTRRRGSGTYITPRLEQPLSRLSNFSDELRQRGFTPGSRWLARETATANAEEILALGLAPEARVSRLRRLRTADNVVMAIEYSAIPSDYLPDPDKVGASLYGYLEARKLLPMRAVQHIRAINATAEQAALAGIEVGTAMLHITRIGYQENGLPIELTHSYCRNDYYDFVAELRR